MNDGIPVYRYIGIPKGDYLKIEDLKFHEYEKDREYPPRDGGEKESNGNSNDIVCSMSELVGSY